MKNIIITPRQIRREVFFLIVAFVVANLMNLGAIIGYDSSWKELFTSIPILLLLSMVLYFLMGIFRLIYYAVSKLL
jgi:hypothetical protein